jgi:hypothetical protein
MWSFIVACIAPAHSSRTLTMPGFLQIVQMCTSVSTHFQVVQSAESVSFHLCRYLLLRDMPHMPRTLILRSFSVSLSDQIFCIRRWSICSSALYVLWLSTGTASLPPKGAAKQSPTSGRRSGMQGPTAVGTTCLRASWPVLRQVGAGIGSRNPHLVLVCPSGGPGAASAWISIPHYTTSQPVAAKPARCPEYPPPARCWLVYI